MKKQYLSNTLDVGEKQQLSILSTLRQTSKPEDITTAYLGSLLCNRHFAKAFLPWFFDEIASNAQFKNWIGRYSISAGATLKGYSFKPDLCILDADANALMDESICCIFENKIGAKLSSTQKADFRKIRKKSKTTYTGLIRWSAHGTSDDALFTSAKDWLDVQKKAQDIIVRHHLVGLQKIWTQMKDVLLRPPESAFNLAWTIKKILCLEGGFKGKDLSKMILLPDGDKILVRLVNGEYRVSPIKEELILGKNPTRKAFDDFCKKIDSRFSCRKKI